MSMEPEEVEDLDHESFDDPKEPRQLTAAELALAAQLRPEE